MCETWTLHRKKHISIDTYWKQNNFKILTTYRNRKKNFFNSFYYMAVRVLSWEPSGFLRLFQGVFKVKIIFIVMLKVTFTFCTLIFLWIYSRFFQRLHDVWHPNRLYTEQIREFNCLLFNSNQTFLQKCKTIPPFS